MSYKEQTVSIRENVLNKKNWLYCNNEADGEWRHLVDNINATKEKYLEHVSGRGVVITAGGYIGMYAYFYSQRFERVYAFEPDPIHFHCLVNNCQSDNVVKIQAALGDEHRLVNVGFNRASRQSYKVHDSRITEGNFEVKTEPYIPLMKIDDLNLPKCDLIQLDVEDYESYALMGAKETIRRCRPIIILENGGTESIKRFMTDLDYVQIDEIQSDSIYKFNATQWKLTFK